MTNTPYFAARENRQRCEFVSRMAQDCGLDASPEFVSRHLEDFNRWVAGYITMATLAERTGVKRRSRRETG